MKQTVRGRPWGHRQAVPGTRFPLFLGVGLTSLVLLTSCASTGSADLEEAPRVGPPTGSLLVAGGGSLGPEIWQRFVELAGGPSAHIVVIPTAGSDDHYDLSWSGLSGLTGAGVTNLTILHTRDRDTANSVEFVAPLRKATGVWLPGGRQWRLVDAYLDTEVHQALFDVLERGGVVGGTSAGASIQGSYLVRGDPATNQTVMAPDYEEGFGLLSGTAVDQHLLARERQEDLWQVLDLHPELLGIGIDEGTAIVVQGDRAEVIGISQVLIYDPGDPFFRYPRSLRAGEFFDLGRRAPVSLTAPEDSDHLRDFDH